LEEQFKVFKIQFNEWKEQFIKQFYFNQQFPQICIIILFDGDNERRTISLKSIFDQKYPLGQIEVLIFCAENTSLSFNRERGKVKLVVYKSEKTFF
jgi:hypothetical protein